MPSMLKLFDEAIVQLKNPALGHGPLPMGLLSNAVGARNGGSSPKFSACFNPHGVPSLEHFKAYIKGVHPPARIQIPLALGGNHMTGLVVDIDRNGQSDVLFFNSLGKSDTGPYYREAKLFIDAVRENFPKKNDYHVSKRFQNTSSGDNYCGDWSMWFLRNAASTPTQSLREIGQRLDTLDGRAIPNPRALRQEHIQLLEQYRDQLATRATPPIAMAVPSATASPAAPTPTVSPRSPDPVSRPSSASVAPHSPAPAPILRAPSPTPTSIPPVVSAKIAIKNEPAAQGFIENILKSGERRIDLNSLADKDSKKRVINAFITHVAQHPIPVITLAGNGVAQLYAEVRNENRQLQARDMIKKGHRFSEPDLGGTRAKTPVTSLLAINNQAQAQYFIEASLKSGATSIDLDSLATRISKKRVISAYRDFVAAHPSTQIKLAGAGLPDLDNEVNRDNRDQQQSRAREIITQAYRSGVLDLDHVGDKDMKKMVLQTFLAEFATGTSNGAQPKIIGKGIIAINEEIKAEAQPKTNEALQRDTSRVGRGGP